MILATATIKNTHCKKVNSDDMLIYDFQLGLLEWMIGVGCVDLWMDVSRYLC